MDRKEELSALFFMSLYRRMQSFVQNNIFFCTKENNLLYKNLFIFRQTFRFLFLKPFLYLLSNTIFA